LLVCARQLELELQQQLSLDVCRSVIFKCSSQLCSEDSKTLIAPSYLILEFLLN